MSKLMAIVLISLGLIQTSSKLDKDNVFKEFEIGSNIQNWKGELVYLDDSPINDSKVFTYKYIGGCCTDISDNKIDEIQLMFESEKLFGIHIIVEHKPDYETDKRGYTSPISCFNIQSNIDSYLTKEYGKPNTDGDTNASIVRSKWNINGVTITTFTEHLNTFGDTNCNHEILIF